jgi:hypothetical protein
MDMNGSNPNWYWIFWWIFTLLLYGVLVIWWKKEIRMADKKNAEKYELLKQYREEQFSKHDSDD